VTQHDITGMTAQESAREAIEQQLPLAVSVQQAYEVCGVSRTAFHAALRRGEVAHFRIGKAIRIPRWWVLQQLGLGSDEGS
jgi:hypothetical protein